MGAAGQHVADPQRHATGCGQRLHVPGGLMGLAEALPEYHASISLPFLLVFVPAHRSQETSVPSRIRYGSPCARPAQGLAQGRAFAASTLTASSLYR
jgi:hypothetical protein